MNWYTDEFLPSPHFRKMRETRYQKHPHCEICKKPYELDPHHISYRRRGSKNEWKDLRMLCVEHHKECHIILSPILRIPLTDKWLKWRYRYVKFKHLTVEFFNIW